MNHSSPGYTPIPAAAASDDDIEMLHIRDDHDDRDDTTPDSLSTDQLHPDPPSYDSSSRPSLDNDDDALLSGWVGNDIQSRKKPLQNIAVWWPQVRGIVVESAPTLLLTTISLLFTGKLLDQVSRWRAMREVDQLIMIIPAVLNLKGNLEMNLSARLGTAANVGELDSVKVRNEMIKGNLALLQVQAVVVAFVAAGMALVLGLIVPRAASGQVPAGNSTTEAVTRAVLDTAFHLLPRRPIPHPAEDAKRNSGLPTFTMVASTSITSASLSGLLLGTFMCTLIVLCRKYHLDPDNIAPAIASCLGDLITLCLIGVVSTLLIPFLHTPLPLLIAIAVICWGTFCLVITLKNEHVRPLLTQGWTPLFGAMIISCATGIVLDMFVSRYEGFAVLAVVISGLPGAAGSIFVSRLSTSLHLHAARTRSRDIDEPSPKLVALTLLLITLPVEIVFLSILHGLGWLNLPFVFVAFSVVFFCCAVTASLLIARFLTSWLWSINRDPDMYALPVHSALMDLIGQLLLVLCFEIVSKLGGRVRMKA
ncbi:hypothetical protein BDQ17DRAFT_1348375 [Cyathus striatus]|nr:hypothetical protein BDQ17DRAFT_1348375 [Cyathus striatus]